MKLTVDEIKLVVFVLLALLVGAAAKHYRASHPIVLPPAHHRAPARTPPQPRAQSTRGPRVNAANFAL